jgi:hypothetical protein
MITPPVSNPCYSNIIDNELPLSTTVSTTGPFINSNQNVFEKLTNLEVYLNIIY